MWHERLRAARRAAGLSLRELAAQVHYSRGYLHDLETGRRKPTPETAARLGVALGADLILSEEDDRLAWTIAHPDHPEPGAADHLSVILGGLRRLEDTTSAAAVLPPVLAHVDLVSSLADQVPDRDRLGVVDQLGQWEQFAGWLHAASGDPQAATEHYGRALNAALEANRPDLAATALSMRGHLAWQARRPGPLLSLTEAALRQAVGPAVRLVAMQQLARGHALAGQVAEADRAMARADHLADHVTEVPPWMYFHDRAYLEMQRGLVLALLGRPEAAAEAIAAGLAALEPERAGAAWTDQYRKLLSADPADSPQTG
ncbi:helix-turn-helix transcriptional regulator [Actinoplanes sp. NPDC051411]|uniref:helix-turn-helix domain-containing protein n=1 Tax=Actinoplanes sp. NPDC051411 TaxID=3155522 RepID=UPI0034136FE2